MHGMAGPEKHCSLCIAVFVLVVFVASVIAFTQQKPSPEELLQAVHKKSDLRGLGSYVLTGTIVVNPGTKDEKTGSLAVYREHDRVRVDVKIGEQVETRITAGDKDYLDPNRLMFGGTWLTEFDRIWDPDNRNANMFAGKSGWGNLSRRKIEGVEAWCMERKHEYGKDHLCVDAAHSVLLDFNNHEFSDYSSVDNVTFPQTIKVSEPPGAPIEVRKIQVATYPAEPELFSIPAGFWEFETCDSIKLPQMQETPTPIRTDMARHETLSSIPAYVFVDKQGKAGAVKLAAVLPHNLQPKVLAAVGQWRFSPATCNGKPVNIGILIHIPGKMF